MAVSAVTQAEQQALLDTRNKAVEECRAIAKKATDENRAMTAEEQKTFKGHQEAATKAKKSYDDMVNAQKDLDWLESEEASLDEDAAGRVTDPAAHAGRNGGFGDKGFGSNQSKDMRMLSWNPTDRYTSRCFQNRSIQRRIDCSGERAKGKYNDAFSRYLKTGNEAAFTKAGFNAGTYMAEAQNGMRSDDEERGGYFIASEEFVSELLKNVDDMTFVQGLSRVFFVRNARNLGVRRRVSKFRAWNWGSELQDVTRNMDTSLKYGKKELTPHYLVGSARISRDLIRSAAMPVESMVMDESSIDLAEILEQAYLYATGNQRPLGVMVPSTDGISTARDTQVITADVTASEAATTHFGFNSLIRAKYSLKQRYRARARWMLHRDTIARMAMIRDNEGQYIWQPSKIIGDPDTALGLAIDESEWMPNTFSTGLYYGLLADWSQYWIAFGMELEVLRLNEIRARQNEIEYIMRIKVDAMPMLEEAFVRLQLG